MDKEYAYFLLNKNRDDYNRIAQLFDITRDYIPKDFQYLRSFIKEKEKILDLGCGNGRLSEFILDQNYIGLDVSDSILKIAQKRYPKKEFRRMDDPIKISFSNDSFDTVFCLAVLHHIPSRELREKYLSEINRVLKKDGRLIVTVWDLMSDKKAINLLLRSLLSKILKKSRLDFKDIFYPWKDSDGNILAQRYIHVFSPRELRKIVRNNGFEILETKTIERSKKGSNILIVCKKRS